jgi:adenylate cyclase
MGQEIERKFLVKNDGYKETADIVLLKQGYIFNSPEKVIRVRICDDHGYLTIKSKTVDVTRLEYEYEIPVLDAHELLLNFSEDSIIEKRRYLVDYQGFRWEIDEFGGANAGLVVAEIELEDKTAEFSKPDWVGQEVSEDPKYLNSYLAKHPYEKW